MAFRCAAGFLLVVSVTILLSGNAGAADPPKRATYDAGVARLLQHVGRDKAAEGPALTGIPLRHGHEGPGASVHVAASIDPAVLAVHGFEVGSRTQDAEGTWHATVRLPLESLPRLLAVEGLARVEAASVVRPHLDRSVPAVEAPVVHGAQGAPPAYAGLSGNGVLVGIVDSGIDTGHEDFLDAAGESRILWLWDQTDTGAQPGAPAGFGYGTEWDTESLNTGAVRARDEMGHGTHVAAIAAGSGRATGNGLPAYRFVGMAPRAHLVVVKTDFSSTGVVDAVDYVFRRATELGFAAVVNLSLGSHAGPHDGTGSFSQGIDALVGPGRLVVASAGNDGGRRIHAEMNASRPSERITIRVGSFAPQSGLQNDVLLISAQVPGEAEAEVRVVTPGGTAIGPVTVGAIATDATLDGTVFVDNGSGGIGPNGHRGVEIQISDGLGSGTPAVGTWSLEFTAGRAGGRAEVDAWIYWDSLGGSGAARMELGLDDEELVAAPAVADGVLAVGSWVTRAGWTGIDGGSYAYTPAVAVGGLSPFSSPGPRRDGVLKPDLVAPGQGIFSALSQDVTRSPSLDVWVEADGQHMLAQGTSQAAPHVTGALALLLERYPALTPVQARDILTESAREDAATGDVPNAAFGYGKLDVPSALDLAAGVTVSVSSFTAQRLESGVDVRWFVADPGPATQLRLERQEGGGEFEVLDSFPAETGERGLLDPGPVPQDRTYRLVAITEGADVWLGEARVEGDVPLSTTAVLRQNRPNPFNPRTTIPFFLPAGAEIDLAIFDLRGRRLRTLVHEAYPPGDHQVDFDGLDDGGRPLPSGVYVVGLDAAGERRGALIVMTK